MIGQACLSLLLFAGQALAQVASNSTNTALVQSTFTTPANDLAFAINVPSDSTTDLYFTLALPNGVSWGAIGLGADSMKGGALVLMVYESASGNNVTLSPRLVGDHSEPVFFPDLHVETLAAGSDNGTLTFSGRCSNCRSWPGGSLDVTSTHQSCIYATGPNGVINSDAKDAGIKYHENYGTFTMDLKQATGPAGIPVITAASDVGSVQGQDDQGKVQWTAIFHAVFMIGTFVGLMPFGVLILRVGGWVRWHAVNQGLALVGVLVGAALGIEISTSYNRSKAFGSAHQVIGLLVFAFVIAQFLLGFFHHRIYKRTQQPTKLAPYHVWLGRLILVLGMANGFTGFSLALSPGYNYILAGLVLVIVPACLFIMFISHFIRSRRDRSRAAEAPSYDPQQLGQDASSGQDIIMDEMAPKPKGRKERRRDRAGAGIGAEQTPREYV